MADTLTFQQKIARVLRLIGSYTALSEATNDNTSVGGLVFGNESYLLMIGFEGQHDA